MESSLEDRIVRVLQKGPLYEGAIPLVVGGDMKATLRALSSLRQAGKVERVSESPMTWRARGVVRCPECDGFGMVRKTADNARVPGPPGMLQECGTCEGSGAVPA